jgi:hypothetical protein
VKGLGRFRIRSGAVEIEYEGEDAEKKYSEAFAWLKAAKPSGASQIEEEAIEKQPKSEAKAASGSEEISDKDSAVFDRLSKDAKVDVDRLRNVIAIIKPAGFKEDVPRLQSRPGEEDAVYGITYLLQVGWGMKEIELSYLKNIIIEANGYTLPFNALGRIIERLEDRKHLIRSQTQKRYKPLVLSMPGLDKARELVRSWVEH